MYRLLLLVILACATITVAGQWTGRQASLLIEVRHSSWPFARNPQHGELVKDSPRTLGELDQVIKPEAIEMDRDLILADICGQGYWFETPADMLRPDLLLPVGIYPDVSVENSATDWLQECASVDQ